MKPKDQDLKEWLYLELINHPTFDEMLETVKNHTHDKVKCEACQT